MVDQVEETPEQEARSRELMHLVENRRLALDSSMSQVPALIVAAQAFLLQVITRQGLPPVTRWTVAGAGVVASIATGWVLWMQRRRERDMSSRVSIMTDDLGIGDPRRPGFDTEWKLWHPTTWRGWAVWEAVLVALILADIVAASCR